MHRVLTILLALSAPLAQAADSLLSKTPSQQQAECQAQLRAYRESIECFAPYRLANGGIRPEAFKVCKEVKQPAGCHNVETSAPPPRYIDGAKSR
jgi:hypothetical protein